MSDLPHSLPASGLRFKGQTLRLLGSVLFGLVILLLGGVLGVALISSLVAALAGAAVLWLAWLLVWRTYKRAFRPPS